MEEYIEKLISQIRCKKARPYIEEEIRNHIEDQISENVSNGMDRDEATLEAVKDMGDPVSVGVSLDKIHKPRFSWTLVAIVGVVSLVAILVQWIFVLQFDNPASVTRVVSVVRDLDDAGNYISHNARYMCSIKDFINSIILGLIIMTVIYFIDYTLIAKYSQIIGFIMLGIGVCALIASPGINGTRYYLFNVVSISMPAFFMMYVPIYGAIIYKYRGGGVIEILKCLVWLVAPTYIVFRLPSLSTAPIILICMLTQLTVAICKGWFTVNKKVCLAIIWAVFTALPIIILSGMYSLNMLMTYQADRIKSWLNPNAAESGYVLSLIRDFVKNSRLIGNGQADLFGYIPDLNRDYIFTFIINTYGLIAGAIIIAVLATLIAFIFGTVLKQKNEVGLTMGIGCAMLLLASSVVNILGSVGILPTMASFLPFFSAGGSNMVLCFYLLGLVMSIYRYKDIYPRNVEKKVKIKKTVDIIL